MDAKSAEPASNIHAYGWNEYELAASVLIVTPKESVT